MLECTQTCVKVIVIGDGNVGKTSMLRRFVKGEFMNHYRKTIGAEFMEKNVFLRDFNRTVKLMLWDTAGQEVFNSLTQAYYRGAAAAVVTFSTVDRDSFNSVLNWKNSVENVCGPIPMVLCQTKLDLLHEATITNEEAEELATQLELPLFRVSSKDDFNVTELFEYAAEMCLGASRLEKQRGQQDVPAERKTNKASVAVSDVREGERPVNRVDLRRTKLADEKKRKKKFCKLL